MTKMHRIFFVLAGYVLACITIARGNEVEPRILSCVAGLPRCVGVSNMDEARKFGCPLVNVTARDGSTTEKTCDACKSPNTIRLACIGQGMKNHTGRDGTPVTFSLPVDVKSVKAEYFVWTFSDGSTSRAECATPNGGPANEDNEHQTIAIIGDAGGWTSKTIASLHINGPLMLIAANGSKISADGLRYSGPSLVWENGVRLLDARLEPFSTKGETTRSFTRSKAYPNHCHVNFPTSTHRIRLLFDGGVSVDGVNPLTPTRVDLFDVRDVSGAILPESSVLGLADLGGPPPSDSDASAYAVDMDNYLDICLNLGDNDPKPASVDVICGDDTQISMPKGLRASPFFAPRQDPRCTPHSVTLSGA